MTRAQVKPQDRRASRRNPVEVRLEISDRFTSFSARTVDVSRGGLFVATAEMRPVGTLLRIKVIGPRGEPIHAVGVVVRGFTNLAEQGESEQGIHTMGMAIALTSTSEAWDLFWDDVEALDAEDEVLDELAEIEYRAGKDSEDEPS